MKKIILFTFVIIFSLSATTAFAVNSGAKTSSDKSAVPVKTENKLTAEEVAVMTARVEEIRDMDKSSMTNMEKRELKKELKAIKENVRKDGGVIYISVGTLLLIVLIIILI